MKKHICDVLYMIKEGLNQYMNSYTPSKHNSQNNASYLKRLSGRTDQFIL